jgi:hypothetical protein
MGQQWNRALGASIANLAKKIVVGAARGTSHAALSAEGAKRGALFFIVYAFYQNTGT